MSKDPKDKQNRYGGRKLLAVLERLVAELAIANRLKAKEIQIHNISARSDEFIESIASGTEKEGEE